MHNQDIVGLRIESAHKDEKSENICQDQVKDICELIKMCKFGNLTRQWTDRGNGTKIGSRERRKEVK
eukprot:671639-Hanusia_phi.AAC.2